MGKQLDGVDVFKILSHDTRRRLLKFIGDVERATFTDLSKIEPKPGKLYYHLRVMGDLIKQNEDGSYSLTEYGHRVYRLMIEGGSVPSSLGLQDVINAYVGKIIFALSIDAVLILDILLLGVIFYGSYVFNLAVLPFYVYRFQDSFILTILFTIASTFLLAVYLRYESSLNKEDFVRSFTGFVYSLSIFALPFFALDYLNLLSKTVYYAMTAVLQIASLLFFTSSISATLKKSFIRSLVVPLLLHYLSSFVIVFRILNFS